jgi:hypothetical protein
MGEAVRGFMRDFCIGMIVGASYGFLETGNVLYFMTSAIFVVGYGVNK